MISSSVRPGGWTVSAAQESTEATKTKKQKKGQLVILKAIPDEDVALLDVTGLDFGDDGPAVVTLALQLVETFDGSNTGFTAKIDGFEAGSYKMTATRAPGEDEEETGIFEVYIPRRNPFAGQSCPDGEAIVGFDPSGNIICASLAPPEPDCEGECQAEADQFLAGCLAGGGDPTSCEKKAAAILKDCLESWALGPKNEMEFTEAESNMNDLVSEYQQ